MSAPIEFWFDFVSPYAFFASQDIEALAERTGRAIRWRPFMLGAALQRTGALPLTRTPMKSDYAIRDWQRIARARGNTFHLPDNHPHSALAVTRIFYAIEEHDAGLAQDYARKVFDLYFGAGFDVSSPAAAATLAATLGLDPERLACRAGGEELKARVKAVSDEAIARGVFGAPFFFADGEPFWGWDRLPMLERWIAQGGW